MLLTWNIFVGCQNDRLQNLQEVYQTAVAYKKWPDEKLREWLPDGQNTPAKILYNIEHCLFQPCGLHIASNGHQLVNNKHWNWWSLGSEAFINRRQQYSLYLCLYGFIGKANQPAKECKQEWKHWYSNYEDGGQFKLSKRSMKLSVSSVSQDKSKLSYLS